MTRHERAGPMSAAHVGLVRRVGDMMRPVVKRRRSPDTEPEQDPPEQAPAEPGPPEDRATQDLRVRIERLEGVVEGLQDALYRQAQHHDEDMDELRRSLHPEEIARSLSADARRRGL
jgi:hypothetical protein